MTFSASTAFESDEFRRRFLTRGGRLAVRPAGSPGRRLTVRPAVPLQRAGLLRLIDVWWHRCPQSTESVSEGTNSCGFVVPTGKGTAETVYSECCMSMSQTVRG